MASVDSPTESLRGKLQRVLSGMRSPLAEAWFSNLLYLAIGFASFWATVGLKVLNPTNIGWLERDDGAGHFLGWHFFRNSDWEFPLGQNANYGLEFGSVVLNTDSIPPLAIALKIFSEVLPMPFQYEGLWILISFLGQAVVAGNIGRLLGLSSRQRMLFAGLLTISPALLWRIDLGHFTHTGQFLVLFGILIYLSKSRRTLKARWGIFLFLVAAINPYILAMILPIWVADVLRRISSERGNVSQIIGEFALVSLLIWLATYVVGYGLIDGPSSSSGFGYYKLNLLGPIDSNGWSRFFPDLPSNPGEHEGYVYFGLGWIALIISATILVIARARTFVTLIRNHSWLLVAALGTTAFSVSNVISLGTLTFEVPIPSALTDLFSTLRSSGRMFWPVMYLAMVAAAVVLRSAMRARVTTTLLAVFVIVQLVDLQPGIQVVKSRTTAEASDQWDNRLDDDVWTFVAENYTAVRTVRPQNRATYWREIGLFAGSNNLSTNLVSVGRISDQLQEVTQEKSEVAIKNNLLDSSAAYVVPPESEELVRANLDCSDHGLARADGILLVLPGAATQFPCDWGSSNFE